MKARWEQLTPPSSGFSIGASSANPPAHWYVVDEDDEIIAGVNGADTFWNADVSHGNVSKRGVFLSEAAAKRKVEKWLSPTYTFQAAPTAWVYGVAP